MSQSRLESGVEAVIGTLIGFAVGVLTQVIVMPFYGIELNLTQNMSLCAVFTVVSLLRGYIVRRWCENHLSRLYKVISHKIGGLRG